MSNELSLFGFVDETEVPKIENIEFSQENAEMIQSRESTLETLTNDFDDDFDDLTSTTNEDEPMVPMKEKEETENYTKKAIFNDAVDYFNGDELAAGVWIDKYALKNAEGELLEKTPNEMHRRLAKEFARIEKKYANPMDEELIYSLFERFRYIIPQGSPMAGVGNNYQISSLSNCFVIGNDTKSDSYGGIMKMDEEQVQLMKRRGGVGMTFLIFALPAAMLRMCPHFYRSGPFYGKIF
jgi:hypothetical protein